MAIFCRNFFSLHILVAVKYTSTAFHPSPPYRCNNYTTLHIIFFTPASGLLGSTFNSMTSSFSITGGLHYFRVYVNGLVTGGTSSYLRILAMPAYCSTASMCEWGHVTDATTRLIILPACGYLWVHMLHNYNSDQTHMVEKSSR